MQHLWAIIQPLLATIQPLRAINQTGISSGWGLHFLGIGRVQTLWKSGCGLHVSDICWAQALWKIELDFYLAVGCTSVNTGWAQSLNRAFITKLLHFLDTWWTETLDNVIFLLIPVALVYRWWAQTLDIIKLDFYLAEGHTFWKCVEQTGLASGWGVHSLQIRWAQTFWNMKPYFYLAAGYTF